MPKIAQKRPKPFNTTREKKQKLSHAAGALEASFSISGCPIIIYMGGNYQHGKYAQYMAGNYQHGKYAHYMGGNYKHGIYSQYMAGNYQQGK